MANEAASVVAKLRLDTSQARRDLSDLGRGTKPVSLKVAVDAKQAQQAIAALGKGTKPISLKVGLDTLQAKRELAALANTTPLTVKVGTDLSKLKRDLAVVGTNGFAPDVELRYNTNLVKLRTQLTAAFSTPGLSPTIGLRYSVDRFSLAGVKAELERRIRDFATVISDVVRLANNNVDIHMTTSGEGTPERINDQLEDIGRRYAHSLNIHMVLTGLRTAGRQIASLARTISVNVRTHAPGIASEMRRIGGEVFNSVSSAASTAMSEGLKNPYVLAAVVALGLAMSPVIGAAVASGILLGVGGAGIAAGIALVVQDPRVAAAGSALGERLKGGLQAAAGGFIQPVLNSIDIIGDRFDALQPQVTGIFDTLAPTLEPLVSGLMAGVQAALPGLQKMADAAVPLLETLATSLPILGVAVDDFGDSIAEAGPGAATFFEDLLKFSTGFVVVLGNVIEGLSKTYKWIRDAADESVAFWKDSIQGAADLASAILRIPAVKLFAPETSDEVTGIGIAIDTTAKKTVNAKHAAEEYARILETLTTEQEKTAQAHADTVTALDQANRAVTKAGQNEARVARDTAKANADAHQRVNDARASARESAKATKQAEDALTQARKDAALALQDQANTEEAANIALERARVAAAKVGKYFGPLQADFALEQRDAVLQLDEATKNAQRTAAAGVDLRARGIEGAPAVIAASDSVRQAQLTQAAAQRAVNEALDNERITIENGKQARADALQATIDAEAAQSKAKTAYEKSKYALDRMYESQGLTADRQGQLNDIFSQAMTLNTGNVPAQLLLIQEYIEGLKLMAKDVNLSASSAMAIAKASVTKSAPVGISTGYLTHHAKGGPIYGRGTGTSDSVDATGPMAGIRYHLSTGEHVWTAQEVEAAGGHHNVKKLRAAAKYGRFKYASGGAVEDISRLDLKTALEDAGLLDTAVANLGGAPRTTAGAPILGSSAIASIAYSVANTMRASARAMLALFEAGIVESGFKNYANKNVPESLNIPHEAVGSDHRSVGYLQQQTPGWGTAAELMNPAIATRKFLNKAIPLDANFRGTAGQLAQRVQVSAFPDRYDAVSGRASALLAQARGASSAPYAGQHYRVGDTPVFGGGVGTAGPVPGFPPWPSSPSASRGDSGVWRNIVRLIMSTGPLSGRFGNAYRPGDPRWHGSGRAVDWMDYNQDALATAMAAQRPLELIHRTKKRDYAFTRGKDKGSFNNALMEAHRNHIHLAMAEGGPVLMNNGTVIADNGAILPPRSRTVVENRMSVPERVGNGAVTQNITINNPLPERTSDSLPKTLRRARAALGG